MYPYLWLIVAFSLNAIANIFVKHANSYAHLGLLDGWMPTPYARTLAYAIMCLGTSFIFFALASRALPISLVYSIHIGASLLILTLIAWYFMGEVLSPIQYLGILILVCGATLIMVPNIHSKNVPGMEDVREQ